jgi:hypothetical protein
MGAMTIELMENAKVLKIKTLEGIETARLRVLKRRVQRFDSSTRKAQDFLGFSLSATLSQFQNGLSRRTVRSLIFN